jgi:hypothetical protein
MLRKTLLHFILIAALGILVYSNTFDVPFQFDDKQYFVEHPAIKDFRYFLDTSKLENLNMREDIKRSVKTRYVTFLSFWANYKVGGRDVTGYHVVNTAIHIINALLVYLLVTLLFKTPFLDRSHLKGLTGLIALFSGLLFVCHPIQTQAVTYIYQRLASLTAMFYLLSCVIYIKWRLITIQDSQYGMQDNKRSTHRASFILYVLSLLSTVLAMKSKEIAFTLPLMITLIEFMFFRGSIMKRTLRLIPYFITVLIIPFTYMSFHSKEGGLLAIMNKASMLHPDPSRHDYFLSQFGVITKYISLLFMPVGQSIYFDGMLRHSFSEPSVFLPFLFLLFIFCLGIYMLISSRKGEPALRLVSFGIFWFFLALSVESSVLPIQDIIFEHRVYLPSAGIFVAIAMGVALITLRLRSMRKAVAVVSVAAVLVLSGATYARNTVWKSEISLWEDTVKKAPSNLYGHYNLGRAYADEGLFYEAIEQFQLYFSLHLNPVSAHKDGAFMLVYRSNGTMGKAMDDFIRTARMGPNSAACHCFHPINAK